MSRRRRIDREELDASFELDLAPMLALMVTLIPIMLLATQFVKVAVIETPLPQAVQQAIEEDSNNKDRQVTLTLNMTTDKGFEILVQQGRATKKISVPKKDSQWDLETLQAKMVEIKQNYPKVFQLNLNPGSDIPYNDIVKVMDEARTIKDPSKKVEITDKENNKVMTEVMFPNVIFANVVEG